MKKLFYTVVFFQIFLMGCQNVLKEEIVSGITAQKYYIDADGINAALTTGYATLKEYFGRQAGSFNDAGTDMYGDARGTWAKPAHQYDGTLNSSWTPLRDAWRSFYKAINIYNTVINRAPEVIHEEKELNRILGEARFLRGFVYFYLVQIWGDVHLTTEETIGVELEANRTPAQEIYNNLIIPDLDFAIANLSPTTADFGRATQPAAKAIRAEVAMVLRDWVTASKLAKSVINDYPNLKLTKTYKELWDMNNEKNSEVILSVQFSRDPLISGSNENNNLWTPWYSKHRGLRNSPYNGGTWVGMKPTPYFYGLWNKAIDRRFEEGLKSVWYADAPGGPPIGDTALYYSIDVLAAADKAASRYVVYDLNDLITDDSAWPQPYKVRDESRTDNSIKPSRDVVIVRVAEMYLIVAEAEFHQGNMSVALDYMNTLRRQRAKQGKEIAMQITTTELNIDFILDEWGRELFAEGKRWFILKRLGLLVSRVKLYNPYGLAAKEIKEYHNLRPIPLEQIDRTRNGYPQNPGYN